MPDSRHATRHAPSSASLMPGPLPDEARLTAGTTVRPGRRYGFFTDTTLCIGCKACEVACKTWNALPAEREGLSGHSYDNTRELSCTTWRHVKFVERMGQEPRDEHGEPGPAHFQNRWLMLSDVCKHCARAPCLEACPTGALVRTEFDTVVVQADICNGCGYCVPACPFGVVDLSDDDGKAHKCTLCYDRLKGGLEPACAKACPTDSIRFGELDALHAQARERVRQLQADGVREARLYGMPDGESRALGGLNAFFLLTAPPQTYNLPPQPQRPARHVAPALATGLAAAAALTAAAWGGAGLWLRTACGCATGMAAARNHRRPRATTDCRCSRRATGAGWSRATSGWPAWPAPCRCWRPSC